MSRCAKLLGDAVGADSTVPMKNYLWLDPVYEDTFTGAANILEADSASEDVMDNYDIPAQEVEVSKDHPDNLGRNVTYRMRLGSKLALEAFKRDARAARGAVEVRYRVRRTDDPCRGSGWCDGA
ncbi:hypothetical protein NDU88_006561 [Pleurodeles waltl]|uniref:Uncharacterized protein n=1 Tax=Pleurodeles waltl TaxID=8319 RepID=A0AAV7WG02_PLEWA|nr:hypothetical protein NDU88_006561 [Pleurodeles waltl]